MLLAMVALKDVQTLAAAAFMSSNHYSSSTMYFTDPRAAPTYLTSHTIVTMLAFLLILNLKGIRK